MKNSTRRFNMTGFGKKGKFHISKKVSMAILIIIVLIFALVLGIDIPQGYSTGDDLYLISEENKLVVYTAHKPEIYEPIIQEFEEKTGIWVEVVSGSTSEMLELIAKENGTGKADVMFGGGVDSLDSYSPYFEPYTCANSSVLDDSYASSNDTYTVFSSLPTVFIYNTKLINYNERPRSWKKLLSGAYNNEIAFADPCTSGSSYTAMMTMLQVLSEESGDEDNNSGSDFSDMSEDEILSLFMEALGGDVLDSSTDVVTQVIAGRKTIGITTEEVARKNIENGANIEMIYPEDGTAALPDGCAIVKGASHLENAKTFIDFVSGMQVQSYLSQYQFRRSVRTDLSTDSDINVILYDIDKATAIRTDILSRWTSLKDSYEGGANNP